MSNLTYIDLSYNGLHGALPTELGRINNLEALLLRNNEWSGLLPTELAELNANGVGQLAELSLASNSLSGTLPSQCPEGKCCQGPGLFNGAGIAGQDDAGNVTMADIDGATRGVILGVLGPPKVT